MQLHDLSDKLTGTLSTGIDEIRDRTAEAVGGDGGSVFRELGRLSKQIAGLETHLSSRIDDLDSDQSELVEDLADTGNRTSWPRRLFWLLVGVAAGYGIAYLTDPDRGQARRQKLGDELNSRADEVRDQVATQTDQLRDEVTQQAHVALDAATQTADDLRGEAEQKAEELRVQAEHSLQQAQGAAVETAKDTLPERPTDDPGRLEDRIKSEVFGYRDDVDDVVIKVDGPGQVALKGTVPTSQNERDLLASVAEVEGVVDVRSELTVRSI
ncbi:YtxH domain-containing protein [Egicoccus halophilus]|uniref:BON domain-containing protein n=1 Tax=Egicoccus halophilus TaxID=1670830 RepID=A0A8J3AA70_9ACTN|nr:YtxH domain-containing protein [Egicoccus halophilus]GGI08488.1 hypothetical protein GCM10011354_29330 [Egicoccus halophilus]